jgi:hypothetical protein
VSPAKDTTARSYPPTSRAPPVLGAAVTGSQVEFQGKAHLLPAQEGWEEVPDYALDWAVTHATGALSGGAPSTE